MPTQKWRDENQEKLRKYRREWYYRNQKQEQEKARKRRKIFRKEQIKWFNSLKQQCSCIKCGESESICLDFHHTNPKKKKFTIASNITKISKKEILNEIKKCVVLCSHCHRKLHAGMIEL